MARAIPTATLFKDNGEQIEVKPANGRDFKLDELYKMIETDMVQVIGVGRGKIMILDEEGKFKPHRFNTAATAIAAKYILPDDYIAGHAVVCKRSMMK